MELATYATLPSMSRGRLYPDFTNIIRSPFQRDRDRLIHSSAFRRLDGKTQVFAYHEGKNYRTRLTHSIEVAQITRTLCKCLNLNEELGEAIALAHDLGHSPFGHAGERGLQNAMRNFGGFDHNIHSLKIMTKIEVHYPDFSGLNLTWETLEGTVKHNGPINEISSRYLEEFNKSFDLDIQNYSSLESQVASFADDIAYNNHDIDDGCRAGFFTISKLRELPFINDILNKFEAEHPGCDENIQIYAVTRNMIARMIFDILENSKNNLQKYNIQTAENARTANNFIVDFSLSMHHEILMLRQFLKENFYTHPSISRMDSHSQKIVEELFAIFMNDWKLMPEEQRLHLHSASPDTDIAEAVCEFIANMTDICATEWYARAVGGGEAGLEQE